MKEILTIGYLTATDPNDKRSWSGIHYRMWKALENEFSNVVLLGPIKPSKLLTFKIKYKCLLNKLLFNKGYNSLHNSYRSKYYGNIFNRKLKKENIDVIFAPAASVEVAHLKTKTPICYLSDTSFAQINEYYKEFSNLSALSIRESNDIEQTAINKSQVHIYSSIWAADFAKSYYNAKNTFVINFGANIDFIPNKEDIQKNYNSKIKILFLGVDWKRKGGDIVLETIDKLSKKYENFQLIVCGCKPPSQHPKMTVIPFLDKNKEEEKNILINLMSESHILFIPTRADCTPIAFSEANAYGIPVVTTDTGGVTSIIHEGVNGFALPLNAKAEDYAQKIGTLFDNIDELKKMGKNARECYEHELNWDIWGQKMREILLLTANHEYSGQTRPVIPEQSRPLSNER